MKTHTYEELVTYAAESLDELDLEGVETWLALAESKRKYLAIAMSDDELTLKQELAEIIRDYPVPIGFKRRVGVLGCGNPDCKKCYIPLRA